MPKQPSADNNLQSLLLAHLADADLIANPRSVTTKETKLGKRGAITAAEVNTEIEGQPVTLQIGLDPWFPQSLPLIALVPWDTLGFIPHVEPDGNVCYAQKEGLLLNRRDSKGIINEAIQRVISVLASGYRGENRWDFIDEFEAYWANLADTKEILSVVTPTDSLRIIIAGKKENASKEENPYIYLSDDASCIRAFHNTNDQNQHTHRNALYIPLSPGTFIMPPLPNTSVGIDYYRDIVQKHLKKGELKILQKLARKSKREEVVIFRLPRPSGSEVLFGVLFEGIKGVHPLLPGGNSPKLSPLLVRRRDKTFLLPRGGANEILQGKRVLLLGCGSVGGFLAFDLVRSGILDITLVDEDILTAENAFRHVLGKDKWGKAKAEALKEELQQKFPYVKVFSLRMTAQKALDTGVIDPTKFSMIIIGIGDDTTSLYLNEKLHGQNRVPSVLFTWLEPYGIGGHVLTTGNANDKGCFECLFTPTSQDLNNVVSCRAAFAAPNQAFSKDISGCADRFTPYGSQDAEQTAALASRVAIQILLGKLKGNPLVSWKGDATDFLRAGYQLSPRYNLSIQELEQLQYDYQNDQCLVCGLIKSSD